MSEPSLDRCQVPFMGNAGLGIEQRRPVTHGVGCTFSKLTNNLISKGSVSLHRLLVEADGRRLLLIISMLHVSIFRKDCKAT